MEDLRWLLLSCMNCYVINFFIILYKLYYYLLLFFYSSFLFPFSSKLPMPTDILHSKQESRNSSQIKGSMNIHQVRPLLTIAKTMIWFNDCSRDFWTTFDLSWKYEFRDPCTPSPRFISTWNAPFRLLQSNLPPVYPPGYLVYWIIIH